MKGAVIMTNQHTMLLTIDIGNTNTVLGVFRDDTLLHSWRIKSDRDKTSDEFGILMRQLLESADIRREELNACAVCSVVPPLSTPIARAVRDYLTLEPLCIGPGIKTGISIRTDNPREVGSDRIVNSVAAYALNAGGAIVVDFGTATTFDCVSPQAEYLGGIIAPGVRIGAEALASRTAKLPRIDLTFPESAVGTNTATALRSGITYGYVDMVDGLVTRLRRELPFDPMVIATGGLAPLIATHSTTIQTVDEDLTLQGLRLIHERNREHAKKQPGQ